MWVFFTAHNPSTTKSGVKRYMCAFYSVNLGQLSLALLLDIDYRECVWLSRGFGGSTGAVVPEEILHWENTEVRLMGSYKVELIVPN